MANRTDEARPPRAAPVEPPVRRGLSWRSQLTIGVSLAAIGALLVVAAGVLLLLHRGSAGAVDEATGGQPTGTAGPNGSAPAGASTGPSAEASTDHTVTFLYDGYRAQTDLDEASITLPAFGNDQCPSGATKFHSGRSLLPGDNPYGLGDTISAVVVADVTGDGQPEHVVLVTCKGSTDAGGYAAVVVALTGPPSGPFALLRQIITGAYDDSGTLTQLTAAEVAADRTVRVLVHTYTQGADSGRQWHTFTWNGTAFTSAGNVPAPVPPAPTQLSVKLAVSTLKLQGSASAGLHGQLSYTVTNHGGAPSTTLLVDLSTALPLAVSVPGALGSLTRTDSSGSHRWTFNIAAVPVGATLTGTMMLTLDPSAVNSAPRSAPFQVSIVGFDYEWNQANVSGANKATLTVTH